MVLELAGVGRCFSSVFLCVHIMQWVQINSLGAKAFPKAQLFLERFCRHELGNSSRDNLRHIPLGRRSRDPCGTGAGRHKSTFQHLGFPWERALSNQTGQELFAM